MILSDEESKRIGRELGVIPPEPPSPPDHTGKWMLSILIPTIPQRKKMFERLLKELQTQVRGCNEYHPTLGNIEILVDDSKRFLDGGLSIGKKREALVSRANAKYLCFLDDDESISPQYAETLIRLCYEDKDVCSFRNISKFDGYWCVVDMSMKNQNEQSGSDDIVRRRPWHICPVRSEFAKQIKFPDINYGEDWEWFEKVLVLCRTEAKTKAVLHQYNGFTATSEADKITKYEQEMRR